MENEKDIPQPLLSICIPTYNRARFLNESLSRLQKELIGLNFNTELLISDNHSTDETEQIVHKYMQEGVEIRYLRNEKNLGADLNFIQCFQKAKGKYIWLLGDDDYIKKGYLSKLLNDLNHHTYGLIHLKCNSKNNEYQSKQYSDTSAFFINVSYFITFISANIFNSKYIPEIEYKEYIGSYFIQMPYYIQPALSEKYNLLVDCNLLDCAADNSNNGGYNYFDVFVTNYLTILGKYLSNKSFRVTYEKLKYNIFRDFHLQYIDRFLFRKDKGRFKTDKAWHTLLRWYGKYPYFYILLLLVFLKSALKGKIRFHDPGIKT